MNNTKEQLSTVDEVAMKLCEVCRKPFRYPPSDNKDDATTCAWCTPPSLHGEENKNSGKVGTTPLADVERSLLPTQELGLLREQLAALCHEQWSGWMRYVFNKAQILDRETDRETGREPNAARWQRQMETPYAELADDEKESDRKEADRILALLNTRKEYVRGQIQGLEDAAKLADIRISEAQEALQSDQGEKVDMAIRLKLGELRDLKADIAALISQHQSGEKP